MRGNLAALSFVAACACAPNALAQVSDPWEGANRDMFAVHEAIDQAVLEPVAKGYRAVTPHFVRTGVTNFLGNLKSPVIFVNDVLQAEPSRAGATVARFGINTTIGLLGLFDPASAMGIERHDEDFGQTLAVWGVDSGPYLFIPLLGPTTIRDGAGRIVDLAFDPLTWATFDEADETRLIRTGVSGLATREALLDQVDEIRENSLDPYVTFRSSYGLVRESAIRNGPTDVEDLPEFDDVPQLEDAPIETPVETPQINPGAVSSAPGGNQ